MKVIDWEGLAHTAGDTEKLILEAEIEITRFEQQIAEKKLQIAFLRSLANDRARIAALTMINEVLP